MFSRSDDGLSAEHLFHNVEIIVYCEGKPCDENEEGSSLDEYFWSSLLAKYGKKVQCKSAGSKTDLKVIANKVAQDEVENVVVAFDRDYDDLNGAIISHPRIIYTFGYSWESDVVVDFDPARVIPLFATTNRRSQITNEFVAYWKRQSKLLRRIFALDFKYFGSSEALFDREKPLSIVDFGGGVEPRVNVKGLLDSASSFKNYQTAPLPAAQYSSACGVRRFFGKTVSRLFFQWFIFRTRRIAGVRKTYYETFMNMLIEILEVNNQSVERNKYYRNIMENI